SLVEAAAQAGADAIELGIPFSDPLADGRTIQAASQVALKGGMTVARALTTAKAARMKTDVPLLFMTYLNPLLAFGLNRFCRAAAHRPADRGRLRHLAAGAPRGAAGHGRRGDRRQRAARRYRRSTR